MGEHRQVSFDAKDFGACVVVTLDAAGMPSLPVTLEPQAACEFAEKVARAAHVARYGKPLQSDMGYLQQEIKSKVTDQLRDFLVTRVTHMLRNLRHNAGWSDPKLAAELVDVVLSKAV